MPAPINISGSRSAAVLGLSPYQSRLEVYLQIMGEEFCNQNNCTYPVTEKNISMQYGNLFEDAICAYIGGVRDREKLFVKDYITCHIDGVKDGILIENKITSEFYFRENFGDDMTDKIPLSYQCQVQHNMYCADLSECLMTVVVFPKRPDDFTIEIEKIDPFKWLSVLADMGYVHQFKVMRNDELIETMLKEYSDFWNNHITTGIIPDPEYVSDVKLIYRSPVGTIILDENMEYLMAELSGIRSEIGGTGNLAKRADMIKTQVLDFARKQQGTLDDDSADKMILRGRDGKKLGSYFKNKNGVLVFK